MTLVATAQSRISIDVKANGEEIRRLMREANDDGAQLIHFPEGALSGYVKSQIKSWNDVDWSLLNAEIESIKGLALELSLWTVFGSNQQSETITRPYNSLYVISDQGLVHCQYNKRLCSHTEITDWYSPGTNPCVFSVGETRFGCLLCIEIQFPELFMEYERMDVDCILFSAYSKNPMFAIQAQGHAACNSYWLSFSVPTNVSNYCSSRIIGPDGSVLSICASGESAISYCKIDPSNPEVLVPIQHNRPWRRKARSGEIYESWRK